jgi:hypothetical protein
MHTLERLTQEQITFHSPDSNYRHNNTSLSFTEHGPQEDPQSNVKKFRNSSANMAKFASLFRRCSKFEEMLMEHPLLEYGKMAKHNFIYQPTRTST